MAAQPTGLRSWLGLALLVPALGLCARAQVDQLLPEIDVYHKLSSEVRFTFQAKETREGGSPTQAEIGPSLDFYLKPLIKLKKIAWFDLDDSKTRFLVLSIGYRYLPSPNSPPENRIEPVATFHFPLKAGFLLSDRNRADLDWQKGNFTWRYRNLIQIEKRLTIRSYHLRRIPLWSSFTRANLASGVIRQSTLGACSQSGGALSLTLITSTRTILAKAQINNSTSWA